MYLSMSNMGGNEGLVGSLDAVNTGTVAALEGSNGALVGAGIDPEGINTNPGATLRGRLRCTCAPANHSHH